MPSELATLRLEPAAVTSTFYDGNVARQSESHFLDLLVDDRSLRLMVGEMAQGLVTEFNRPWLPEGRRLLIGYWAGVPPSSWRLGASHYRSAPWMGTSGADSSPPPWTWALPRSPGGTSCGRALRSQAGGTPDKSP